MDEDMIADTLNVGDKVECVRDSPDNNDSIAIGMQGVICVIVESSPHHGALLTNMTGARLPANGFPIESTPVMTK